MTFLKHLAKTEAVATFSLLAVAAALAVLFAVQAAIQSDPSSSVGVALVVFAYTMAIGCIPVVAFGAPLYAWLLSHGRTSWAAAIAIGVIPGLVLLLVAIDLGLWAIGCGAAVALATHVICRPGPNQSFKPTPSARLN
jgi:hypothetical protein